MSDRAHRRGRRHDEHEQALLRLVQEHGHATITDAAAGPDCRNLNVALLAEAPRRFVLEFLTEPGPGEGRRFKCAHCDEWHETGERTAIAIIPGYTDDIADLMENAWAVGANPGGTVGGFELPIERELRFGSPSAN